jgi:lysozyme
MLQISDEGVTLVKTSEAFRGQMYNCPAGHCTIGYGHLVHLGPVGSDPKSEAPFLAGLTEVQASALLREDLRTYEAAVHHLVKVSIDQSEYDALVDFEYNLGTGALAQSTLLKKLNAGDYDGTAVEFDRWVNANGHRLAGLVARRDAEEALFRRDLPRVPLNS